MARTKGVNVVANNNGQSSSAKSTKVLNGRIEKSDFASAKTDRKKWRLLDERGRQTWHYLATEEEEKAWPQSIADKHHLGLEKVCHDFGDV
jgi:lanosterol synthase